MEVLGRNSGDEALGPLFDFADGLLILAPCSLVVEVFTTTFSISQSIVLSKYMFMRTVFTIMLLLG